ncbi:MAG: LptF/LptG family permease [Desulfobulbus sp.]|nr:LptF/LptG family permease [Desulfobulbus sp.]
MSTDPPATKGWRRPEGDRPRRWSLRPPLLLWSYVATEMLAPFFASFVILYSVFFLIRLIPLLEVVLALQIGLADFVRLFSYIFPHMLLYVIPMACMAGVIIGFTRMTNDREILAFKVSGISLRRMLPPIMLTAAAIALLTGYFSIRLIPAGELGFKQLMFTLAKEKIDKGLKEREFTEALGDLVVYVEEIDDRQEWHGVYVSDMRGRVQPLITMAKVGRMSADMENMMVTVVLDDGTLHNVEGRDNQIIHFQQYQLQIPLRPPTLVGGEDVTTQNRNSMSQQMLQVAAAKYGPRTKVGRMYLSEYHHRLTLPVGCFLLSLLGLPLGLQAGPGRQAVGIPLGLGFFILYYISFTICRVMSEEGTLPMPFGMWLPNLFFLVLTVIIFHRVDQELPLVPERLQVLARNLFSRTLHPIWERTLRPAGDRALDLLRNAAARWRPQQRRRAKTLDSLPHLHIHADSASGVFHLPGCEQYDCPQCRLEFKDAQVAREAGFEPCPFCRTLVEEQERRGPSPPTN